MTSKSGFIYTKFGKIKLVLKRCKPGQIVLIFNRQFRRFSNCHYQKKISISRDLCAIVVSFKASSPNFWSWKESADSPLEQISQYLFSQGALFTLVHFGGNKNRGLQIWPLAPTFDSGGVEIVISVFSY